MAVLITYDDVGRREDLLDLIVDVSPDDNPLVTMLGTAQATNTLHEWLLEYLSRPQSVTNVAEGADATFGALTQPTRANNITAIIRRTFQVSGTERAVKIAGQADPFDYQAAKALRLWKMDAEYTVVNGARASGASGVARGTAGLMAVITTLATARNSGTSLSETEFQDMVQDSWTQAGQEYVFDLVLVPFGLKRKIDGFTAGATKNVDASDKRLTAPVQVYETSGGVHRIMSHRDVVASAGTVAFIGIKEDLYKLAYLRNPVRELISKVGDSERGMILGEFTLQWGAERSSVLRTGYATGG